MSRFNKMDEYVQEIAYVMEYVEQLCNSPIQTYKFTVTYSCIQDDEYVELWDGLLKLQNGNKIHLLLQGLPNNIIYVLGCTDVTNVVPVDLGIEFIFVFPKKEEDKYYKDAYGRPIKSLPK